MVPNPVPGGEEPTSTLPLGTPQTTHLADADAARELEGSLKEPPSIARDKELAEVEPPQSATGHSAIGVGATDQGVGLEPMVRRIEARGAEVSEAEADKLLDAFSPMPRPPEFDLGIELAQSAQPQQTAAAEAVGDGPVSEPEPSADARGFAAGPRVQPAAAEPPVTEPVTAPPVTALPVTAPPVTAPKGIEPLASALDAAVRLAADASVAAEALENLKRLLQHKQQLDGLRSAQAALARPSPDAEASASEAPAAPLSVPPPPLRPLPLPVHAEEGSAGNANLPLVPRRRPSLERRGLDVRGFLAGFALSWAFGVVLYFFMTAG